MFWNNYIIFVGRLVKYNFDPLLAKLKRCLIYGKHQRTCLEATYHL